MVELKGRLRVRVMCQDCGYVQINGTKVWVEATPKKCPDCNGKFIATVELPNGVTAPTRIIRMKIYDTLYPDDD